MLVEELATMPSSLERHKSQDDQGGAFLSQTDRDVADKLDGVLDTRLEREALERHEHVPDFFPAERLAVDDDEGQARFTLWIPLDPTDQALVRRQLPAELGPADVSLASASRMMAKSRWKSSHGSASKSPRTANRYPGRSVSVFSTASSS